MSSLYALDFGLMSGSGLVVQRALAGENLGNRKLVYMHTDETWRLADWG